ncbi:AAA family ATPase [Polaromonas sp.]|uniref:AAA family ATPase n=1 Tax=Polaromonas sp. TaxID=1869339 RepID=UPI003CA7A37F
MRDAADKQFRNGLYYASSTVILFDEESGLLPNKIDITDEFVLDDEPGEQAVANFLTIAGIDLEVLVKSETRARAGILKAANRKISDDFRAFWSQTIGENVALQLECSIHQHPFGHEKAGKSYLEFLITDATAPLYPKQRSKGTRWFISFFLQLRASSVENVKLIFLLDEPGANLHEKAQADVLRLIEKIRATIPVIYSTHSPHLMNEESFHRILAVERDPEQAAHPTRVIGAHALGAASRDTLSPIFTMMGASRNAEEDFPARSAPVSQRL